MSVLTSGQEVKRDLRQRAVALPRVTFYQTDWAIAAIQIQCSPILQLPMAQLNTNGKGRIWGTWIPTKPDLSAGVSLWLEIYRECC